MTFAATLELVFKPEVIEEARAVLARELAVTRSFAGSLGVEVLVDDDNPHRFVLFERWASKSDDDRYREFRGGSGQIADLPSLLSANPKLTRFQYTDI